MKFDKELFAKNLRAARAKLGISQEEFAKRIGVSQDAIRVYESGNCYVPGVDKIMSICDVANISPNDLVGWEEVA